MGLLENQIRPLPGFYDHLEGTNSISVISAVLYFEQLCRAPTYAHDGIFH